MQGAPMYDAYSDYGFVDGMSGFVRARVSLHHDPTPGHNMTRLCCTGLLVQSPSPTVISSED